METATGALSRVITKLGVLLNDEYYLPKRRREEIMFLQSELESMEFALKKLSNTPTDQLNIYDKIWARDLSELSDYIEDSIDKLMIPGKLNESAELSRNGRHIAKIQFYMIATRIIRDIKSRVSEVHKRCPRYDVNLGVDKPTKPTVDPRLFSQYTMIKDLVGIDETRDELIKILMGENGVPSQQGKIVSIVGFGGMGKTTLANAVYEKISAQFDCYAFVSVSRTPDLNKLFKDILYQLDRNKYDDSMNETFVYEQQLINELREFLQHKRYGSPSIPAISVCAYELFCCC
jgi:hypothetical protein